ncbi:MAG TPA: glycosyltransferase [Burkholderiales bacterium]|nr:glycosyltransferase [Burkholderiales bacterium]
MGSERPCATEGAALFVGRLDAESGIATLAEALEHCPCARVDVIGAGPEEPRVRRHARMRVLGGVSPAQASERMRRAAYLVLPVLACGEMPPPLVSAFALSLPVIASRLGPIAELIESGRNGLLFEPGSARELASRLAWAEAFPEKMRQMGECAKADYESRLAAQWTHPRLFGERRRATRI